jgi:hypothetical protein
LQHAPDIVTAIPKRRYRIGEFNAVVLGEVECRDPGDYIFVLALVRDGESEPVLYVALVRTAPEVFEMRVTVMDDSRTYPAGASAAEIDEFSEAALDAAVRLFKLRDETPYRVM